MESGSTKYCSRCGEERNINEFYRNAGRYDGLSGFCIKHQREADRTYMRELRAKAVAALGGHCCRCGFTDLRALQIDHPNGGGRVDRQLVGAGTIFLSRVIANPDHYQLLCANCNWIKKFEDKEHVGARVYVRNPPTEKLRGVGRGNSQGSRLAAAEWWASATDEQKVEHRRKTAAGRLGSRLVMGEDGKRHFVHP